MSIQLPAAFNFLVNRPAELTEEEKETKRTDMTFAFLDSINNTKEYIYNEDTAPFYSKWKINRFLASDPETCIDASEVNCIPNITDEQHYRYLLHSVRKKNRRLKYFAPKKSKNPDLEAVCEHFNCTTAKGREYLALLTPADLEEVKRKVFKGGRR